MRGGLGQREQSKSISKEIVQQCFPCPAANRRLGKQSAYESICSVFSGVCKETGSETRLGLVFHFREITAPRGNYAQQAKGHLQAECAPEVAGHHDFAHPQRQQNHFPGVRTTFLFVSVKQARSQPPLNDGGKFPRQVMRVANAAVHSLPCKRRRKVGGVTSQKNAGVAPAVRHTRMKRVYAAAPQRSGFFAVRTQQFSREFEGGNLRFRFAFMQHELKPACPIRSWKRQAWARGVAKHLCVARGVSSFFKVQNEPALTESRTAEFNPQLFANGTPPPITCHEIGRSDLGQAAVGTPQNEINSVCPLTKVDQFRAKPGLRLSSGRCVRGKKIAELLFTYRLAK